MAVKNTAINAIVRYLNDNSIPTPIQYARVKGLQGNYDDGNGTWNTRSVKYILTNRTYAGMLVQGKEKRVVKGSHPALVDEKTFDRIQSALQQRAFHLTSNSSTPITPSILKGKVICGCCGGKMQRRRGTNHANWYFFTCPTNNRVGSDCCTGMYVREEDIFSAIYYQLKLFLKSNSHIRVGYHSKKTVLEQEIAEFREILSDPVERMRMLYEQLVSQEIDKDTYWTEKAKINEAKERLECVEQQLDVHERQYQQFMKLQKVLDKDLPLDEVMDCIDSIVVGEGRHIEVKWQEMFLVFR